MTHTPLLPERHPNADFFIADIFDSLPVKNDRHTMEHPFFALSTNKDIRSIKYSKDGVQVKLSPSAEFGLPTMMDKDILLYVGSLLMAEINKGRIPPKTLRFSGHDLMVTTNRETNGKAHGFSSRISLTRCPSRMTVTQWNTRSLRFQQSQIHEQSSTRRTA